MVRKIETDAGGEQRLYTRQHLETMPESERAESVRHILVDYKLGLLYEGSSQRLLEAAIKAGIGKKSVRDGNINASFIDFFIACNDLQWRHNTFVASTKGWPGADINHYLEFELLEVAGWWYANHKDSYTQIDN